MSHGKPCVHMGRLLILHKPQQPCLSIAQLSGLRALHQYCNEQCMPALPCIPACLGFYHRNGAIKAVTVRGNLPWLLAQTGAILSFARFAPWLCTAHQPT